MKDKDLKVGSKIVVDNDLFEVLESVFSKLGRGKSFNRVKLKSLSCGKTVKKVFRSGENIDLISTTEKIVKYMYCDSDVFYFLDVNTLEYYELSCNTIGENRNWLKNDVTYNLILWGSKPLYIKIPKIILLKVVYTDKVLKQDVSSKNFKNAKLETGVSIKVPLFIEENDLIKVRTDKYEYAGKN